MNNSGKYIETELKKLFYEWKLKQKDNIFKYENLRTRKLLKKEIFLPDGLIDSYQWGSGSKALYIYSEANKSNFQNIDGKINYIKRAYQDKEKRDNFYNNIQKLHKHIFGKDDLGDAAFLNIYKKGNIGLMNYESLSKYAEKYFDFIIREIKIIEPEFIICLGVFHILNKKRIFKEFNFIQDESNKYLYKLNLLNKDIAVLDMYQPISKKQYIEKWYKKRFGELTL